jgi:RNA polymerase sigma factor for flagellar operon FliA
VATAEVRRDKIWEDYKRTKDERLRNRLITRYLPLVRYTAEKLLGKYPHHVELDDLRSAGTFGLMAAIRGFDPSRNVKFETYCINRIRGAIQDELRSIDWVPRMVRTKASKLDRALQKLESALGRRPTDSELAEHMGMTLPELAKTLRETRAVSIVSLTEKQQGRSENKDLRKVDMLEDNQAKDPSEAVQKKDIMRLITKSLSKNEKLILCLYYFEEITLREIGEILNLSESRVCQLHSRILKKLKEQLKERRTELMSWR